MKVSWKLVSALFAATLLPLPVIAGAPQSGMLVFEGRITKMNPMPLIEVSCGVLAPTLVIKYEIDRIYSGVYRNREIVIDHLACGESGIRALKEGDHVVVVAKRVRNIRDEIDPLRLRNGGAANRFFLALIVGQKVYELK